MKLSAAIPIPNLKDIFDCNPVNPQASCPNAIPKTGGVSLANLSDIISLFLAVAFYAAIFMAFYYLVWGAFNYIMAQGKKEDLAKARARITWALIGLIVVFMAYFIARFVTEILGSNITGGTAGGGVPF